MLIANSESLLKMKTCRNLSCKRSNECERIRNVAVVTGTRAEYGLLRNLLLAIEEHCFLNLQLIVTGMHLLKEFGYTINDIIRDKREIALKAPMYDRPDDVRKQLPYSLSRSSRKIGQYLLDNKSDFVVVLGDRLEAFAGAIAGLTANVPIVHLHGGELARGDMDDRIRYAISALANIHCVATSEAKRRLVRTGQNPEHIFVTGALALDEIFRVKSTFNSETKEEIFRRYDLRDDKPFLVVLHHPAGFGAEAEYKYMKNILQTIRKFQGIIIGSNNDPGHSGIRRAIDGFMKISENTRCWRYVQSLPRYEYLKVIYAADLLVGNSSSGIFEANALGAAVVNIGPRQLGRQQNGNAIFNVDYKLSDIRKAIKRALQFSSQERIRSLRKFGTGRAGRRIADVIANVKIDRDLLVKKMFPDITN